MTERVTIDGVRLAAYGNCIINSWYGVAGKEQLAAFEKCIEQVDKSFPDGIVFFVVVEPGAPILTAEQRKEMEQIYARFSPRLRGAAQVVEGGNLWSLTARSVMTALRLVQRRPYPTRVFSDVLEGAEWAAQYVARPENDNSESGKEGLLHEIKRMRDVA